MPDVRKLRRVVDKFLDDRHLRGDAKLYSKTEWKERGEPYGNEAALTLVIDGSPMFEALNCGEGNGWKTMEAFQEAVESCGFWYELGFAWSVHFYER